MESSNFKSELSARSKTVLSGELQLATSSSFSRPQPPGKPSFNLFDLFQHNLSPVQSPALEQTRVSGLKFEKSHVTSCLFGQVALTQ